MKAYSKEFRSEVLAACDSGQRTREVAKQFKVRESWVRRIKQERRESGNVRDAQRPVLRSASFPVFNVRSVLFLAYMALANQIPAAKERLGRHW